MSKQTFLKLLLCSKPPAFLIGGLGQPKILKVHYIYVMNEHVGYRVVTENPIKTLYPAVRMSFAYTNNEMVSLLRSVAITGEFRCVLFSEDPKPISSPFANLKNGTIEVSESYASYLWTVCHLMVGLFDYIQKRLCSIKAL